ncbi:MAG: hypothetical protein EBQ87_00920 [Planctomycetes bacterium]|nr:hypothetical protein [Planctomycetota bacterium]
MNNTGLNFNLQKNSITDFCRFGWLRKTEFIIKVLILISFLTAKNLYAEDWPSWRGPTGQGISQEKNLPLNWNKNGTNILWKEKLPGQEEKNRQDQNQSSPIIIKNKIFISASFWREGIEASKEHPEHHVACFDLFDGKKLWDTIVKAGPWKFSDLRGGYTAPTPTSDGQQIYVVFGSSVIIALDLEGKILWRTEIIPFDFDVAIGSSPIVTGNSVILQCDGTRKSSRIIAFDKNSGKIQWEKKRPQNDFSHSTPTLVKIGVKEQLLVAASNALQGIDPTDGTILWSCAGKGDTASPVMNKNIVYMDSGRGGPGIAVDPSGQGDVSKSHLKWKIPQIPEGLSSPIIFGDFLYRSHNPGILSCRNLNDGSVVFSERLQDISTLSTPFVTTEGYIYFASAGKTFILKAGPKFELISINDLGDLSPSSPAVSQGRIVIKGKQYLYCIGSKP